MRPSRLTNSPMNLRLILAAFLFLTTAALAADLPAIPAASIAQKKELLFSDDFEGAEPALREALRRARRRIPRQVASAVRAWRATRPSLPRGNRSQS